MALITMEEIMRMEPTRMLEMLKPKASLEFLCAFLWSPRMLASRVYGDEGKLVAVFPRRKEMRDKAISANGKDGWGKVRIG